MSNLDSENDPESSGSTTNANSLGEEYERVAPTEKESPDLESPGIIAESGDVKSSEVPVVKASKKKASTERAAPRKRQRVESKRKQVLKATSTDRGAPSKQQSHTRSERNGSSSNANNSGDGCARVTPTEEESRNLESPGIADGLGDIKPAAVPVVKATKRKAPTQREAPRKRQRVESKRKQVLKASSSERGAPSKQQSSSAHSAVTQDNKSTSLRGHTKLGDYLNKYSQLNQIGQGGYGSVYAGTRRSDDFPVAIKYINECDVRRRSVDVIGTKCMIPIEVIAMHKAAGEPEFVGRSAVVSLLDWYDLGTMIILVMERPNPSLDLSHFLRNCGKVEEDFAKNIMKQVVEAAIEMDHAKVFHRDFKTPNILLQDISGDPRVRIVDFGVSLILWRKKYSYHNYYGTPAYIPPELYTHGTYQAGPTTVWQLGGLLYDMLHGVFTFDTLKFMEKQKHIRSDLSHDCQDFFTVCLAVEPEERATLEQILQHPWLVQTRLEPPTHHNP
ncbi:serine/threonine-protein kinase pim-2-like [Solea solea]|uniref:serine/threonine-protein kinase pim-2-like n=1 Tax=Solea solea TaxID=90069 RepID=UPI00272A1B16|nr:serine/threonine-protein kinase pim-2-like [Solea solea]